MESDAKSVMPSAQCQIRHMPGMYCDANVKDASSDQTGTDFFSSYSSRGNFGPQVPGVKWKADNTLEP